MKKIIGIGNALMDVVVKLPDHSLLEQFNLPKGSMVLVDAAASSSINQSTSDLDWMVAPGGSVANAISGLANLGTKTAFIGKVGSDDMGRAYSSELEKNGIIPKLFGSSTSTGLAMALVTPDGERTFATYLGAAIELEADNLSEELFIGYDFAYIEGYLVQNHDLLYNAMNLCKKAGLKIVLDLASYNVVKENLAFLKEMVNTYVDIVFANEDEAMAFTGKEPYEAVEELARLTQVAVVKLGKEGSLIRSHAGATEKIGVHGSFQCVDTTGAGDLYSAGFLHAYALGHPLSVCGEAGALVAGYVVSVFGARMTADMWNSIRLDLNKILEKTPRGNAG